MDSFRIEALQSGPVRPRAGASEPLSGRSAGRPRNNSADEPFLAPLPSVLIGDPSSSKHGPLSKRQEAAVAPSVKIQVPSIFKALVCHCSRV